MLGLEEGRTTRAESASLDLADKCQDRISYNHRTDGFCDPATLMPAALKPGQGRSGLGYHGNRHLACPRLKSLRVLSKIVPRMLLSAGGFVAISHFHNGNSTQDIDYIIDPRIENLCKIKEKLQLAIGTVAKTYGIPAKWVNSRVEISPEEKRSSCCFKNPSSRPSYCGRGRI
jgi:hypothetical protein